MRSVQEARIRKTKWLFADRASFLKQLIKEIKSRTKSAIKNNLTPCFRLNLTSDLAWEKIIPLQFVLSHIFSSMIIQKSKSDTIDTSMENCRPTTISPTQDQKTHQTKKSMTFVVEVETSPLSLKITFPPHGNE